jgi:tetratricopeptide (TPR) repeat protein
MTTDTDSYLQRIGELVERAAYRQALKVCEQALVAHPGSAEVHDYRGLILARMGRFREALPSYDRAIRIEPDFVPALLDKAELLIYHLNEAEPGIALADRVLRLRSHELDHAHAHYLKGVAYANLGHQDEALANYDRSLELDPDHPDSVCERGATLYELYRFRDALDTLKQAVELDGSHARPHHFLGCIYEFMGEDDLARRELERAAELDAETYPPPLSLTEPEFEKAIQEAVHTLPREVTRLLSALQVDHAWLPDRTLLADGILPPSALAHHVRAYGDALPRLLLFQRNFERYARSRADLVQEVAHSISHELGHPEHSEGGEV